MHEYTNLIFTSIFAANYGEGSYNEGQYSSEVTTDSGSGVGAGDLSNTGNAAFLIIAVGAVLIVAGITMFIRTLKRRNTSAETV